MFRAGSRRKPTKVIPSCSANSTASDDGAGRVLALETLTNTPAVANVIREAKTYMLPGIIQTGKKQGMQLMDDALVELYDGGYISAEETYARADQKQQVRQHIGQ